jgi:FAD/FMN-containing dehydrogenase
MSSHKYGLAADWMVGATVVLANASVVHTSATESSDLFWALRGAGSNFGIVTSYEFDTFAVPDEVTYFSVPFRWNATTAAVNLEWLQNYTADTMPVNLNMRMFANTFSSQFEGLYFGNLTDLNDTLQPLLDRYNLTNLQAKNTTWMDAFAHYANAPTDPTYPYSDVSKKHLKSEMQD